VPVIEPVGGAEVYNATRRAVTPELVVPGPLTSTYDPFAGLPLAYVVDVSVEILTVPVLVWSLKPFPVAPA
jgi:hypothetical protein